MNAPINIYSGTKGLGGALTNPTELAFRKGSIVQHYPITWFGKVYEDVERAYQLNKTDDPVSNDSLMVDLIMTKLLTYPRLFNAVRKNGGVKWLQTCSHTYGAGNGMSMWTGQGEQSRFIYCLIEAFCEALYLVMGDDEASFEDETNLILGMAGYGCPANYLEAPNVAR